MIGNDSLKIPQIYRKEKEKLGSEKNIFEISKTRKISHEFEGRREKLWADEMYAGIGAFHEL